MGCSAIRADRIHEATVRAYVRVADEMLDTSKCWYIWGRIVAQETVYIVQKIRAGVLHNMENFSNMCTGFS